MASESFSLGIFNLPSSISSGSVSLWLNRVEKPRRSLWRGGPCFPYNRATPRFTPVDRGRIAKPKQEGAMPLSRRLFLNAFELEANGGGLSATVVSARGREANEAESGTDPLDPAPLAASTDSAEIRIDSNENPAGPGA